MLRLTQGIDGHNQLIVAGMQQADTIYNVTLVANVAQYIVPPAGANFVLFQASGGNDFYALFGVASGLAVPAANITDGTAPELNPLLRQLKGTGHIGLIAVVACNVTLAFYS
jgi:hypothetical protein